MERLKVFKVITSIIIIFAMLCLNVSVDFGVLFEKGAQNGHFVQVGKNEVWATSILYDKYPNTIYSYYYGMRVVDRLGRIHDVSFGTSCLWVSVYNKGALVDTYTITPGISDISFDTNPSVTIQTNPDYFGFSTSGSGYYTASQYSTYSYNISTNRYEFTSRTQFPTVYASGSLLCTINGQVGLANYIGDDLNAYFVYYTLNQTTCAVTALWHTSTRAEEIAGIPGIAMWDNMSHTNITIDLLAGGQQTIVSRGDNTIIVNGIAHYRYNGVMYWPANLSPIINVISPSQNGTFSEADTAFIPQISVSDEDNDTLTCKYYIDTETAPRDTKTATNTTTAQTVSFSALNMSTLTEGNHTIKYEVSDCIATPVTSTVSFKVDKSAPTLSTVSVTSAISSITVSGSATDSIAGLDNYPYQYTIGSNPPTSWITNTTYTQNNLIPNTQYTVIFQARDKKNHIASNTQYIYTKAAVPPALVVNNASSYTLDVSTSTADSNPPSTQYLISTNSGAQYVTQEGTLTSSPVWITLSNKKITVTGLTPSTAYSFQAKARNGANIETAISSAASGTTLIAPPVAPVNLIATATSSQITVSWDSVQGAAGYDIQADGTIINTGTSTTYTHIPLPAGTPHTYQVRARNAGGPGNWSTQITKSTLPNLPDIPVNLSAVPQSTSITVTWNNVPGATGYDIEVDGVLTNNGPNTNYIHSSLIPGTHHTYRVRSINPGGKSDWSAPVNATTTQESSPVPANLTAIVSQTEISLTWDEINGVSGYDIEVDGVTLDNNINTGYTHTNLAPGSQHIYRVRSKKGGILSDWSAAVISTTLTDAFGIPPNITATASDTTVTISWSAVTGAAGYDIEADGAAMDNETSTSAILSGLQPKTNHTYRVRARSEAETSEWSQPIQITTFALPTPIILNAVSDETTIDVVWNTTNAALVYDLEADGTIVPDIQSTSYTCSGFTPNTQHVFRVRARNGNDTSNWSIPLTKSTMFSGVNVPTGLFAMMKNTSAAIVWQPMDGAVSYGIETDGVLTENITDTRYIHTGLLPGTEHTYRVRANNDTGAGGWSPAITVMTIPEGPAVPTNLTASSTTSKIMVSWDQVSGADEYEIEVDGVTVPTGGGSSYLHSGIAPDTQHHYRARSKNAAGYSAWSDSITVNTKSSTMTYTVDCITGDEFNLVFSASGIQELGQYTFTISYDPDELEITDLCGATPKIDTAAGNITGTDIQIVQVSPGTVVFKKTGSAQSCQVWSGTVNSIRFRSKLDGQASVTYSFQ